MGNKEFIKRRMSNTNYVQTGKFKMPKYKITTPTPPNHNCCECYCDECREKCWHQPCQGHPTPPNITSSGNPPTGTYFEPPKVKTIGDIEKELREKLEELELNMIDAQGMSGGISSDWHEVTDLFRTTILSLLKDFVEQATDPRFGTVNYKNVAERVIELVGTTS